MAQRTRFGRVPNATRWTMPDGTTVGFGDAATKVKLFDRLLETLDGEGLKQLQAVLLELQLSRQQKQDGMRMLLDRQERIEADHFRRAAAALAGKPVPEPAPEPAAAPAPAPAAAPAEAAPSLVSSIIEDKPPLPRKALARSANVASVLKVKEPGCGVCGGCAKKGACDLEFTVVD